MPYYTPDKIHEKLREVYYELSKEYNVFYIALYGSQNYNLQTANSDLDFKAIIIPTLEELVNQNKPTSKVYTYDWWQVEVKDIRNYIESAVKVNVNFIELLNTEYYYAKTDKESDEFRSFFKPLLDEQGEIYLRACQWMILQKWHAFSHEYPSKIDVIKKYGYDPKQLCHIVRLRMLMERYLEGNYSFTHEGSEALSLTAIKNWIFPLDSARAQALRELDLVKDIVDNYKVKPTFETKYKMVKFSRDIIINSIKLWLQNEQKSLG